MNKLFIFGSMLLLLNCFVSCKQQNNDEKQLAEKVIISTKSYNLKGAVKSVTDLQSNGSYDLEGNIVIDTTSSMYHVFSMSLMFDKDGKWTGSSMVGKDGSLISATTVQYDNAGNFAGSFDRNAKNEKVSETKATSVSAKRIVLKTYSAPASVSSTTTSDYKNGLVISQKTVWTDGSRTDERIFERDRAGDETRVIIKTTTPDGTQSDTMNVKFLSRDAHGNWTRQVLFNTANNTCIVLDRTIEYYE